MFRFGEPVYLYLLIVLPILVGLYIYSNYRRRKKLLNTVILNYWLI